MHTYIITYNQKIHPYILSLMIPLFPCRSCQVRWFDVAEGRQRQEEDDSSWARLVGGEMGPIPSHPIPSHAMPCGPDLPLHPDPVGGKYEDEGCLLLLLLLLLGPSGGTAGSAYRMLLLAIMGGDRIDSFHER